ncbi:O-antigen ligase family protein [Acinetobacter sp. 1124_18A]|uniref:O-antigen ligase family protein n=1 Tax=Acinetobacter sp. 1124_18A TaxID=2605958 RepID=UPI0040598801
MNPNITAHMAVMLLPFIMLGIRTFKFRLLAVLIALAISIVTASRSATMALALSVGVFALFSFFPRLRFVSVLIVVLAATLISAYGVDIVSAVIAKYSITGDSRLLYTGYNSRDILMQIAVERFKGQPWFGLGFDGAKFELDGHELGTHNGLLDLLLRFGIIGTSIFAIFMLYLGFMVSRQKKPFKPVSAMALVAIMSLSTNSSTFFVFNYLFLYVVVLIYVGYFNRKN